MNTLVPSANIVVPTAEQILAQPAHCQRILSGIQHKVEQTLIITEATLTDYDAVRLNACAHPRAMRAFAIPHKGAARFGHDEWRMAIHVALGIDINAQGSKCPACQVDLPDNKGVHLMTCKHFKGREIKQRHDCLVQHLKTFFSRAGEHVHQVNQEELGWFAGARRPDIVADVLQGPRQGHTILYDVTVTHPFKQAFRNRQDLRTPGAAATEAEETKRRTYTPHIIQPGRTTFVPIGFDVFGGWGASTTDEIENHLAKGANREKSAKRAFADWLSYHLSAAIWMYSAASLCQRVRYIEGPNPRAGAVNWLDAAFVSDLNRADEQ